MKLSEEYPYREIDEKKTLHWKNTLFHFPICSLHLIRIGKMTSFIQFYKDGIPNIMQKGGNYAKVRGK